MRRQRFDKRLELAIHDGIELVDSEPDPVIGEPVLREVIGSDLLAAIARLDHRSALFRQCFLLLLHLNLVQASPQHAHALFPVLNLRFLVLATHHRVGWNVRDPYRRIGGIHRLPTWAGGAERIDAQVLGFDLDVYIFGFRQHSYRYSGSMHPPLLLGRWHTLHAVNATFILELRIYAIAFNDRDYLLQSANGGFGSRKHLHFPALRFRIPCIHA